MGTRDATIDYADLPTLAAARRRSVRVLEALAQRLAAALGGESALLCVAAAGSLARLEIGPDSDLDGIVVARDAAGATPALAARVYAALDGGPLRLPKPGGIYRDAIDVATLCAPDGRGALDESPAVFGKRFQFLLDARALYGADALAALQRRILAWYVAGEGTHSPPAERQATLLLHDLQRYQHAYAAWQQHSFGRTADDGWYLRQAKLGSTRLLGFAGLLLLLGACSTRADKFEWLATRLALTPLERIHAVMVVRDAGCFAQFAAHYEAAHAVIAGHAQRAALVAQSPRHPDELPPVWPSPYAEIHAHNLAMRRLLRQFVLARTGEWHPDFFAALMFA